MVYMKNPRTGKEAIERDENMNLVSANGRVSFGTHGSARGFAGDIVWVHAGPGEIVNVPYDFVEKAKKYGLVEISKKEEREFLDVIVRTEKEIYAKTDMSKEDAESILDQNTMSVKKIIQERMLTIPELEILKTVEAGPNGKKRVLLLNYIETLITE